MRLSETGKNQRGNCGKIRPVATATPGLAARLTVPARPGETYSVNTRLLITVFSVALLTLAWHGLRPSVRLDVQPARPEVGQEVSVSWLVSGAVSVSVRRDGQ